MVNIPSERPVLREADLPVELGGRIQSPVPPVSPVPQGLQSRVVCPRCRETCAPAAEQCSRCGFSFLETRAVEAPSRTAPDALVGQVINGKYRVTSVLGEGGFGVVYKVELILFETGNVFALKLLHPALSRDSTFRRRFLREAALALSLVHENTIQIREFGQTEDGHLFFTMDFCRGEPLKTIIAREGFLTVNRALTIVRQILSVMKLAHARGIIHRDLKPENVFIERDTAGRDFVKVGDFGLAKSFTPQDDSVPVLPHGQRISPRPPGGEDITRGGIVGTPRYMSPEQARGEELDGRSDLFSIGVMLHEMLYGVVPAERPGGLSGQTPLDVHSVPEGVKRILRRTLEPRRDDRCQSAGELLDAICGLPTYTPTYIDDSRAPARQRSRWSRKRLALGAALVLLVCGLTAGGLILGGVDLFGGRTSGWGFARVSYPPGLQSSQSAPLPQVVSAPKALELEKGPAPSIVQRPASFSPFPRDGVRAYLSFKKGEVLKYQGYREGMVLDREFIYEITDEPAPGVYAVKVTPGDRKLLWIVDEAENAFYQEFTLPDRETGQLTDTVKRAWLRLPMPDAVVDGDFNHSDIRVHAESVDLMAPRGHPHCEIFAGCLLVEFREEDRLHYHYYQEQRGLVGIEVYELRAAEGGAKSLDAKKGSSSTEGPLTASGGLGAAASGSASSAPPATRVRVYARYLMDRTGWVERGSSAQPSPAR